jgi:hypothetical protein
VQSLARGVGQGHPGQGGAVAPVDEAEEQLLVQQSAGTGALVPRLDVHADLAGPSVGRAAAVGAAVREADDAVGPVQHQPVVCFQ